MGFGGFGAQGMGFAAGSHGSNYNQAGPTNTNDAAASSLEPQIPGEDPPLPPGDDGSKSQNGTNSEKAIGKITEAITQVASVGALGYKLATKAFDKALKAKKIWQAC